MMPSTNQHHNAQLSKEFFIFFSIILFRVLICPYFNQSFMDKSLEVPRKVSDELLELMSKHLESGKKDGENRALTVCVTLTYLIQIR